MRFSPKTHCPDCFSSPAPQHICERCGFDRVRYQDDAVYLPEFSLLANGRYAVGRVLGRPGGFGIVYCGWHQGLHRRLAIKEFFPRELVNRSRDSGQISTGKGTAEMFESWKSHFLREARLLARFQDHPHVVTAYDVFEDNGTAYMAMERLEGQNLYEYLGDLQRNDMGQLAVARRLNPAEAKALLEALLSALETLHGDLHEPVYHRDLTPNNIFLPYGDPARAKLLDFGLARSGEEDMRHTSTIGVGTPGFAAPEQLHREGRIGAYTDFYALGAVFYIALSGKLAPNVPVRLMGLPLESLAELAPELDPRWCALIDACLDLNPKRRPQSVAEIRERLAAPMPPTEQINSDSRETILEPVPKSVPQTPKQPRQSAPPAPEKSRAEVVPEAAEPADTGSPRHRWVAPLILTTLALLSVFGGGVYWYLEGLEAQRPPSDSATRIETSDSLETTPSVKAVPSIDAVPPEPEPQPQLEPEKTYLTIETTPPEAEVRIMNIAPRYEDGIELEPGEYDLEVSAPGYKTYRDWRTLAAGRQTLKITLEGGKQTATKNTKKYLGYVRLIDAQVTDLRFFESSYNPTDKDKRAYASRFAKSKSRYINWELNLKHPAPGRRVDFSIEAIFYDPRGAIFGRQVYDSYIEADWTWSYHNLSWGWGNPGNWEIGDYRVDLSVEGTKIASGTFSIF